MVVVGEGSNPDGAQLVFLYFPTIYINKIRMECNNMMLPFKENGYIFRNHSLSCIFASLGDESRDYINP